MVLDSDPTTLHLQSPSDHDSSAHYLEDQDIANHSARTQAAHLGAAHGQDAYLSAAESLHSANVGIGAPQVPSGFAPGNDAVTSELNAIYRKIKKLLDRRAQYMELSLQGPGMDPRDQPDWEIYPPPPEPAWDDGKEYQPGNVGGPSDVTGKKRKMGQDIGEDFDMEEVLPLPEESSWTYRLDGNSVYQVFESETAADEQKPIVQIPSLRDFYMDLDAIVDVSTDGPAKSFAFKRLSYLEGKFHLYTLLNEYQEIADSKKVPHRDFYNVRKVDTHVHHSACMNQKHLLRFIKSKMRKSPDEVVLFRDGKHLTLREVFESINLTAYDLSIDTLDMHVSISSCSTACLLRLHYYHSHTAWWSSLTDLVGTH
jgi:AMP deaminase